jgi:mono/diheme cytochrome c family protein
MSERRRTDALKGPALLLAIVWMAGSTAAETGPQASTPADPSSAAAPDASQESPASAETPPGAAPADAPYTVVDGDKVDPKTLDGWKTWRALACERCHGAQQEGLVGPPLIDSLKRLTEQEFHDTVFNGRPEKGMPQFSGSAMVTKNWQGLYAYLKGRSDGQIKPGHLYPIEQK